MRSKIVAATLGIAVLSACATEPKVPFATVATEAEFTEKIVGHALTYSRGVIILNPDGTLGGSFGSDGVVGTWAWKDGKFCRELSIGSRAYAYECQTPQISENRMRSIRADGSFSKVAEIN